MIITISGKPGAGKSTIAQAIAKKLGWPSYSMGDLRREMARKKGMNLAEFNKLGETDSFTDLEVDEYQTKLGQTKDNFVIDGRMSWHFIPQSFKIFLDIEPKVGAERIWQDLQASDKRNEGNNLKTIKDVLASNQLRMKSDIFRYNKYFKLDAYDQSNYDYVLETSKLNIEQVIENIYKHVYKRIARE